MDIPDGREADESKWKIAEVWSPPSTRIRYVDISDASGRLASIIDAYEARRDSQGNYLGHNINW